MEARYQHFLLVAVAYVDRTAGDSPVRFCVAILVGFGMDEDEVIQADEDSWCGENPIAVLAAGVFFLLGIVESIFSR